MCAVPLFDETARDGRQAELASLIRRATRIQPFGPNSRAVHEAGGSVHLTPAEAEETARAVLESDWLRERLAAEREAGAAEVRAQVEAVIKERGYAYRDAPRATPIIRAFTEELRAALNGGE